MSNRIATIGLRILWEIIALPCGFIIGALPVILIAGALAWQASDPGCHCFSQKLVLSKVKIEEYTTAILSTAAVAGAIGWLLLRRLN